MPKIMPIKRISTFEKKQKRTKIKKIKKNNLFKNRKINKKNQSSKFDSISVASSFMITGLNPSLHETIATPGVLIQSL